jgi:hypothetical protein
MSELEAIETWVAQGGKLTKADARKLISEVRRLRGLIKDVERCNCVPVNVVSNSGDRWECHWCGCSHRESHADTCPAFTPDGSVR